MSSNIRKSFDTAKYVTLISSEEKTEPKYRPADQTRGTSSYKKGDNRTSRKSKYSPAKRRLRYDDSLPNGRHQKEKNTAVGMQKVVNLVREKKRREAMDALVNLVEEETLIKMIHAEGGNVPRTSKRKKLFTLRDFNILIKELGDRGYLEECQEVLSLMKTCSVKPSLVTYSTLISRAGAWQKVQLAEKYFDKMEADDIRPDVLAYNSLINAYAKGRQPERALQVLHRMDRHKDPPLYPTVVTFNTLIDSFARAGAVDKAHAMLREMARRHLKANERSYSSLVHAYCEAGRVSEARIIVESMSDKGIHPTAVTYSLLLHALGQNGQVSEAFLVLDTMKSRGFKPNVVTMSSLIYACGKANQLERAFTLLEAMKEEGSSGSVPNSITYSTLVDVCLKAGKVNRAFSVVREMRANGKALTEVTYTSLIAELTRLKQLDRIMEIMGGEGWGLPLPPVARRAVRDDNTGGEAQSGGKEKNNNDDNNHEKNANKGALFPSSAKSLQMTVDATEPELASDSSTSGTTGSHHDSLRGLPQEWEALNSFFRDRLDEKRLRELESLQERAEEIDDALKSLAHIVRHKKELVCSAHTSVASLEELFSVVLGLRDKEEPHSRFISFDEQSSFILYLHNLNVDAVSTASAKGALRGAGAASVEVSPNGGSDRGITVSEADKACSTLLRAFGRYLSLRKAMKFVTVLCRSTDPSKREVYMCRLDGIFRKMNNHCLTVSAFERMQKKGENLNARVYNGLMRSLSAQRKVVQDQELFRLYLVYQEMEMSGVEADTSTYNTLINACATVGDVNKALETLQVMQNSQCEPDVITYTSLIKACSINGAPGMVALAEQLFQEMRQRTNHFSTYINPTEYTYLRLMQTHLANPDEGDTERIWALLEELQQQTSTPSKYTWRACIQAALLDGDVKKALECVDCVRNVTRESYDDKSWTAVAKACEAKGMLQEAEALRAESAEHVMIASRWSKAEHEGVNNGNHIEQM